MGNDQRTAQTAFLVTYGLISAVALFVHPTLVTVAVFSPLAMLGLVMVSADEVMSPAALVDVSGLYRDNPVTSRITLTERLEFNEGGSPVRTRTVELYSSGCNAPTDLATSLLKIREVAKMHVG